MPSKRVTIRNEFGLHARPATKLVECANRFDCEVRLSNGRRTVDGKSIMALLTLAAAPGMEVLLETHGNDEQRALEELESLIASGFGDPDP
ncbi:MAG: HPr family phosphocarrier protein [Xanthomonadales bacterium]|nr:HPr family phosphocarrier protein [Xanthomonadales bacterium]NNL96249.1 HPr family phosphocarrier protein [Xanthomonadales bacterium]